MSNSPLVTYTRLTSNCNKPRNHKIDTITIHCYVGQVTAKQGCDYFASTNRQVSANYVVGYDGSIGLSVEEKNRAWTSSSGANDHRAVTIECACENKPPYALTDKAYKALINLCADICKRNGIKKMLWKNNKALIGKVSQQNMTVHRWFASTDCPGQFLMEHMSDIATRANAILNEPVVKPPKTVCDAEFDEHIKTGTVYFYTDKTNINKNLQGTVKFKTPFKTVPRVVASGNTGDSRGVTASVCKISKTGFSISFSRSNLGSPATSVDWIAVGE